MTVSSIIPVNNHTGNSSTKIFDFDFLIENESELIVHHIDSNGIVSILENGVDYSITEVGNKNGSNITFPLSTSKYNILGKEEHLSLSLDLQIKQESEFHNSSYFNLTILEWTFDYIVRILQILNRKVERCIKVEETAEVKPEELIADLYDTRKEVQSSYENIIDLSNEVKANLDIVEEKSELTSEQLEQAKEEVEKAKEQVEIATQKARDAASIPIGSIIALFSSSEYVPEGYLPCDGSAYTKAQFPDLWDNYLITGLLNTISIYEWMDEVGTNAENCAKFAIDEENETFRVPLIQDTETEVTNNVDYDNGITISASPTADAPFTAPCDGVYMTTLTQSNTNGYLYVNGVHTPFYRGDATGGESWDNFFVPLSKGDVIYWEVTLTPKTSHFYPYKEKTKEKLKSFVVVANGQTNQTLMDWSAWASSLQGKANIDLSNCTSPIVSAPYIVEVSDKSILPSWYRVWSNGWCEQGGQLGSASATSYTVTFLKTFIDTNYALLATDSTGTDSHSDTGGASDTVFLGDKKTSSFRVSIASSRQQSSWEAKGYIS